MRRLAFSIFLAFAFPSAAEAIESQVGDTSRVVSAWKGAGATDDAVLPQFIFDNQTLTVALPAHTSEGCVHVAVIGDRGIGFRAKLDGATEDPLVDDDGRRANSSAGAAELVQCGKLPKRVYIQSHSGRGALDVVVAFGPQSLPSLQYLLPARAPGPRVSLRDVPGTGDQAPLVQRLAAADVRAANDGYVPLSRVKTAIGDEGNIQIPDFLREGCHLIEVFAEDAGRVAKRVDLDAEIRDDEDGRVLVRDRSEAPDAKLEICVATSRGTSIYIGGAAPGTPITITHGLAPLPTSIPTLWGSAARGTMATALHLHRVQDSLSKPVFLAVGASGATDVPLSVEPGACYVASVARLRGGLRSLTVRARVGLAESTDVRGANEAALVAFCSGARSVVPLEVEARGASVAWGLALFRTTSEHWESR